MLKQFLWNIICLFILSQTQLPTIVHNTIPLLLAILNFNRCYITIHIHPQAAYILRPIIREKYTTPILKNRLCRHTTTITNQMYKGGEMARS